MKINSSICRHRIGPRFFHFHIGWRDQMSVLASDRCPEKLIPPLISQIFPSDIAVLLEFWTSVLCMSVCAGIKDEVQSYGEGEGMQMEWASTLMIR